jgi:hypothetical protein
MTNGVKCKAHALTSKPFCYFHTRLHRISSKTPDSQLEPLELPVMEDRSAVQFSYVGGTGCIAFTRSRTRFAGRGGWFALKET